jgi:N utilization substance protein B
MSGSATTPKRSQARSVARLAAVQALYQAHMEGTALVKLLDEFHQHRLVGDDSSSELGDVELAGAEIDFFDDLVTGTLTRLQEIDAALTARLADGWTLMRLDKTMLQVLRAGGYELLARRDVPTGSAISEYVDVAKAFFDDREAKFVNGVLDGVAKDVRS